ncbi:MAG: adenylate/guanylate cyclase domain-containing protein [Myxococcaceae bacterium]|nr:adenylate/guanylate cyclase domain-containing protein [Myxococcaceae bacterium]
MGWLSRRRFELSALTLALLFASLHLLTTEPLVVGAGQSPSLVQRAVQVAEGRLWDLRFRLRGQRAPNPGVVVVAIDEKSAQQWGLWPWSRRYMAEALERLADADVAAVGLDATFIDARDDELAAARATLGRLRGLPPTPAVDAWRAQLERELSDAPDDRLEAAFRRLGPKVVHGVIPIDDASRRDFSDTQLSAFATSMAPFLMREFSQGGVTRQLQAQKSELYVFQALQAPLERFVRAGTSFGHFAAIIDLDGTIRRGALLVRIRDADELFPSMALKTAAVALGASIKPLLSGSRVSGVELVGASPRTITFDELSPFALIDYPGASSGFTTYSIVDVVEGRVGRAELEGKAVLIGVTIVGSSGDQRVTPFKELEPGVYTHAAILSNLLDGRMLERPVSVLLVELLLMLLVSVVLGVAVPRLRFLFKALVISGVLALWLGGAWVAFNAGVHVALTVPLSCLLTTSFAMVFLGYFAVDREKGRMRSTFSRYLGEDVIAIALENPERLNRGEKREMTVLFSDIRGFTTLSERMSPEALAAFINDYLSPMTAIVFDEKGTLDKYIGDALMAFWNAPLDQPDHALRACRAAVRMLERLDAMKPTWRAAGLPELEIGIGINSGPMVVGNMGSDVRVDYTVLGDAVNLGSRLEGTNKEYDTRIIISESTWQQVKDAVVTRRLGAVRVKGKRLPVNIYEVRGLGRPSEADAAIIARFEEALARFIARDFEGAGVGFRAVLEAWPLDAACRRYLAQLEAFKAQPPPSDWDGVASLTTK